MARQTSPSSEKWLVIKLGALGDVVLASPFFDVLRRQHPEVHITLLTTPPYASWVSEWGLFDEVWAEPRFSFAHLHTWFRLWRRLGQFDRIIDLQGVDRTRLYTLGRSVKRIPTDHGRHARLRLQELADSMSLGSLPAANLPGSDIDISIKKPFVMLVPGASKPVKCWPQERFAELAAWLQKTYGVGIVVVGLEPCIPELEVYKRPTSIRDIVTYGRNACLSIGNDTGPQLLASAGGCKTVTFYCDYNPPERVGIWGGWHMHSPSLADLSVQEVQDFIAQHASVWLP